MRLSALGRLSLRSATGRIGFTPLARVSRAGVISARRVQSVLPRATALRALGLSDRFLTSPARALATDAKAPGSSATASSSATPSSASTSSSSSSSSGGIVQRIQSLLFDNRERLRTYATYALMLGGAIVILKGGVWLIEFFGNINFADVGEVAYAAGIATGLALVAGFQTTKRLVSIRPEATYRMILKNVTCNERVSARLGEHMAPGKFRAYSVIDGGLRWGGATGPDGKKYDGWQRFWKPKRIQMLFTLTGSRGTGMISAEVQNDYRGKPYYRVLALDVMDGKGERIILDGDPTFRIDHGPVKLN